MPQESRSPWMYLGLAALVLVVAALALWYALGHRSNSAYQNVTNSQPSGQARVAVAAGSTDPYDVLVTYTKDGYEPRDVEIKKGQRVRFLNASEEEAWPASAIHPTHSLYPQKNATDCLGSEFDACVPVKPGEFFAYTFYYTGDWSFHDHLRAYHSGSVTVTE